MSYFHHFRGAEDPRVLLRRENQVSTPWGDADHGACDKCRGVGEVDYRCLSCSGGGHLDDCPACAGRVSFRGACPACEGSGEITRTARSGVSVFPTAEGLRRYLRERQVDLDGSLIVELEGRLSGDLDLDAETGALLVHPTEIVSVQPAREAADSG